MNSYENRLKLKNAGYKLLRPKNPIRGGEHFWFDSLKDLEEYARNIETARKSLNWRVCGYYTDEWESDTMVPAICQIGKLWFHGYQNTDADSITLFSSPDSDKRAAINNADDMAQQAATKEWEYNERWQEARKLEDRIEENEKSAKAAYENCREWVQGLRDSALSPKLCQKLRAEVMKEWETARHFVRNIVEDKAELKNYSDVY